MYSTKTLLFLNEFPFTILYSLPYKCLSIFFPSRNLFSSLLRICMRRIQSPFFGLRAFLVPLRLPVSVWRPFSRANLRLTALKWLCTATGLRMIRPSLMKMRTRWRVLQLDISLISFGSSQILRLPQPKSDAARRFGKRKLLISKIVV